MDKITILEEKLKKQDKIVEKLKNSYNEVLCELKEIRGKYSDAMSEEEYLQLNGWSKKYCSNLRSSEKLIEGIDYYVTPNKTRLYYRERAMKAA